MSSSTEETVHPPDSRQFYPVWTPAAVQAAMNPAGLRTYFEDTVEVVLPIALRQQFAAWKRPAEFVDRAANLGGGGEARQATGGEMFASNVTLRRHSSVCRQIIDTFEMLLHFRRWRAHEFAEFGFRTWTPLNHIHSNGSVTSGQPHLATLNSSGKYVIRLWHCGCWRAILVDDRIPVDGAGDILLPVIVENGKISIWPVLLAKAILKLRSDFGSAENDQSFHRGAHLFELFTGWTSLPNDLKEDCGTEELWSKLSELTETFHFSPPLSSTLSSSSLSLASTRKSHVRNETLKFVILEVVVPTFEEHSRNDIHEVLCMQNRTGPLLESSLPPELDAWKKHRWVEWATNKGLYTADDPQRHRYLLLKFSLARNELLSMADTSGNNYINGHPRISGIFAKEANKPTELRTDRKTTKTPDFWFKYERMLELVRNCWSFVHPHEYAYRLVISDEQQPNENSAASVEQRMFFGDRDSTDIFVVIDSTTEVSTILTLTNVPLPCPAALDVAHVICEQYAWQELRHPLLFVMSTGGSVSRHYTFPAGRNVLRFQFNAVGYCFEIKSSLPLSASRFVPLLDTLNSESKRMSQFVDTVAGALMELIDSVGQDSYTQKIRNFYAIFLALAVGHGLPDTVAAKRRLIETISQSFCCHLHGADKLKTNLFSILFLWPPCRHPFDFDQCFHKKFSYNMTLVFNKLREEKTCECKHLQTVFSDHCIAHIRNYSATKIQSLFRMLLARRLIECHRAGNSRSEHFIAQLRDHYAEHCVGETSRIYDAVRAIFVENLAAPVRTEIGRMYECFGDFPNILSVRRYSASAHGRGHSKLVPLFAAYLFCHSTTSARYILRVDCVTSDAPLSSLRVHKFLCDNDTYVEVVSHFPDHVHELRMNRRGYLLYVYVSSPMPIQDVTWTFRIVQPRHVKPLHACHYCVVDTASSPIPGECCLERPIAILDYITFADTYWPSLSKEICKLSAIVRENVTCGIFFRCSNDNVGVQMVVEKEAVVTESTECHYVRWKYGCGSIIMLCVDLISGAEHAENENDGTEYAVTVKVVDNWRLSPTEIENVKLAQDNAIDRKQTAHASDTVTMPVPNWTLLLSFPKDAQIQVTRDQSMQLQAIEIKRKWIEDMGQRQ